MAARFAALVEPRSSPYHVLSWCKTINAVQCDRTRPTCNNCTRRRQPCPGYDDVFDGAHRSQNQIARRQVEKHNATLSSEQPGLGKTMPNSEKALVPVPSTSSNLSVPNRSRNSTRVIVDSTSRNQSRSTRDATRSPANSTPGIVGEREFDILAHLIPGALKQNAQDASICFFFRNYAGTAFDPEIRNGFNQLWQPMYLQASAESSLRLATAAVTVNIAMMWCFRGCDTRPARTVLTKAVAAAREVLHDPLQSSTDEILMTILIFDLYDALVLHYAPAPLDYGKHKHGALAVIEHRNFANLTTSQGRALIGAVRHSLLPYLLASRKPFPERSDHLFDHPSINNTKASSLDQISVQLSRVQSRLWSLRLESHHDKNFEERCACYENIIEQALQVEDLLQEWKAGITSPAWLPEYVRRGSVSESIQGAGFYGNRCSIWMDLEIAGTWIVFSIRYLLTLQLIRQSFADEASLLHNPGHQVLLSKGNDKIQNLVDFICETVPFYLGDNDTPKNPMYSTSINFPYAVRDDPRTGASTFVPSLKSHHQKRAAASGGWILFLQLVNLWRFAEPEDDAIPLNLRERQLDWIKAQVRRMQKIFLFSEPVWFKRLTPSPAKSNIT